MVLCIVKLLVQVLSLTSMVTMTHNRSRNGRIQTLDRKIVCPTTQIELND